VRARENNADVPRAHALAERGVASRVATYTTGEPGADVVRLATEHDVDLAILDAGSNFLETGLPDRDLAFVLERAPCDVGLLAGASGPASGPVVVPFGGAEHDWTAIEVAAWLARSLGTTLRLLGTEADPALGRRDASRLLARASLLVQQVVGIVTEPVLVRAGAQVSSKRPVTPACSSSASPIAGERTGSAHTHGRRSGRRRADTFRAPRPPPRRRRPERDADTLHLDARVRAVAASFFLAGPARSRANGDHAGGMSIRPKFDGAQTP
jgi:hypothetical protein